MKIFFSLILVFFAALPSYSQLARGDGIGSVANDAAYVNVTGDTMTGALNSSGKLVFKYNEGTDAADGTIYYDFLSSATVGPTSAASDGITNLRGRYNWYTGDNSNAVINGVEGVCATYGSDESITCRGGMFRTYTAPGATTRTSIGADMSARASYSGGTEIGAESGTAFVGARIWMAPYFTAVSTPNINNFHGLWIYSEHTTVPVTNGIKIESAGGGFTNDLTLQSGDTIKNSAAGLVTFSGSVSVSSANITGVTTGSALCINSAKQLSVCTSVTAADGTCTCP